MKVEYGDEHLSTLVPREIHENAKPKIHQSKFRAQIAKENNKAKFANKTMGPAKVNVRTPENFLKKSDGSTAQMPRPPAQKSSQDNVDLLKSQKPKKPSVPRANNSSKKGSDSQNNSKDFISSNAIENICSVARKPQASYVDTKMGHRNDLITSGLVPNYTLKKDFGRVPEYLKQRTAQIKQAQAEYDAYVQAQIQHDSLDAISASDKASILAGLKEKWEELHHQYQGISVMTDTAPKKNRKERLEAQMSNLERDIDLLERGDLYVTKN